MNKILLTGSGFSKGIADIPLVNDIYKLLCANKALMACENIRKALAKHTNYELSYAEIQDPKEKELFSITIHNIFETAERAITAKWWESKVGSSTDEQLHEKLRYFIQKRLNPNHIIFFTLNHDCFIERYKVLGREQSGDDFYLFREQMHYKNNKNDSETKQLLRSTTQLNFAPGHVPDFILHEETPIATTGSIHYIKLHGSVNWYEHINSKCMVIGTDKLGTINNSIILKEQFNYFKEQLAKPKTSLTIVGYGFQDSHINEAIKSSLDKTLSLHIIDPNAEKIRETYLKQYISVTIENKGIRELLLEENNH